MTNGRELKSDDPNTFMQGIALNTIINKPQCPKDIKESEKGKIPDKKRSRHERYGLQRRCCTIVCLVMAAVLFILGLLTLRFTFFDIIMYGRLYMTPGFPPYELWKNPQPEVFCRIYVFTVLNGESFLNKTDSKLKLKEFGPIIYREKLEHLDVVFHENSTMSYTVRRTLEFATDLNEPGILNKTITVPNIVLLGMAATLADYSFTFKFAFRLMSRHDQVFVNTTVYNYLWNFTSPAFDSAQKIVPFMIHQDNGGVIYNVYKNFNDRVNVRIGPQSGYSDFFKIQTFNGKPTVPGYEPEEGDCFASLQNSSEGALYPNFLTKNITLLFWRKTVCRPIPIVFEKEIWKGSLLTYKYIAKEDVYDRYKNSTADCFRISGETILPDGLSDISKCYNGLPIAISLPHFYGRNGYWNDYVEGFTPSKDKHGSFTIIEPITGVPVEQIARSQSNMVLPKLVNLGNNIDRLSGAVIPMVWMEYHQEKLTTIITCMLVFIVNILPILQYFISVFILIGSGFYLTTGINRLEFERKLRHIKDPVS